MGSYLICPDTEKEFIQGKDYSLCSVRGIRWTQEDGFICQKYDKGFFIGVFDGHGGYQVS
jgi:serine/threonine protein phosphatase PrpC